MEKGTKSMHFEIDQLQLLKNCLADVMEFANTINRLDEATNFKIKLVVSELVTNALKHSGKGGQCQAHVVVSLISDTALRIEVSDEGNGFDPKPWLDREDDKKEAVYDESGRGLMLVSTIADEFFFNERANEVTAIVSLNT